MKKEMIMMLAGATLGILAYTQVKNGNMEMMYNKMKNAVNDKMEDMM